MDETTSMGLGHAVALLAAMVVAATLFRRFGRSLMRGNMATPQPAPYVKPRREDQALNEEAAEVLEDEGREKAGA